VQVQTFALLLAKALKEEFADGHLVEICIVRQQTLLVVTGTSEEVWADNDIALIVYSLASTVGVSQALSKATVDWTDDI
jgi:hypothetical protein